MGFIIVVAIIVFVVYASNNANKANRQKWQSAAQQLKLVFKAGEGGRIGTISGRIHGHRINVATFTRGSGKSSQTFTKYTMEYGERIPTDFKMVAQGLRHGVGKVFGLQDIEVGNPVFDDKILLQGEHPVDVIRFLTPKLQDEIRFLASSFPDFVITNDLVAVNKRGTETDPALIARTVYRMAGFCDAMSPHANPETPVAPADEEIFEPLIIEPVEPLFNPLAPSNPIVPDPPWMDETEGGESDVESEPEPVLPAEEPPDALDLKAVSSDLFADHAGQSLVAAKLFEQLYKGKRVQGSGTLTRVNKFNYDPVFANCQGVKATFEVCELAGTYSRIKVSAVVKYPSKDYDALMSKINATLPISGTLIAQDFMMHQYYIEQ